MMSMSPSLSTSAADTQYEELLAISFAESVKPPFPSFSHILLGPLNVAKTRSISPSRSTSTPAAANRLSPAMSRVWLAVNDPEVLR